MKDIVNLESLKQAIMEAEREKLEKDIREYFCFQARPEQAQIWARYLELEREREQKAKDDVLFIKAMWVICWLLIAGYFVAIYVF